MHYVISDIHGNYDKYIALLEKIEFSDEDTLFILGDVIDRGPDGIKVLQDMMLRSNVFPILGNHEYMALSSLAVLMGEITEDSVKDMSEETMNQPFLWMANGGEPTMDAFFELSQEEKRDILEYLEEFDLFMELQCGGKNFVLVHGSLGSFDFDPVKPLEEYDLDELLFERADYDKVYFPDKYLVTGHTPTRVIHARERGFLYRELCPTKYIDEVYMKNNHIAIDCGCVYGGKLAAICLETLEVFYV